MGSPIRIETERFETQAINMQINSGIYEEFQKRCKKRNLPMYVVIETFCRQYANGRYILDEDSIEKWENNNESTSTLNTSINKEVYANFKDVVKARKFYVRYVLSAFIEDYGRNCPIMEFVGRDTKLTK